jgi:hypothetical protein
VQRRFCWLRTGLAGVVVAVATVGACAGRDSEPRDGLGPDTARFTYGERSVDVALTACGRDGDVVVLAGADGRTVLQVEGDVGEGGRDRTGVTADLGDDGIMGAFGADMELGPAGAIADVRVEGDRLVVEGTWVMLDDELSPRATPASGGIEGRLVARCPDSGDETATVVGGDGLRGDHCRPPALEAIAAGGRT